MNQEYYENLGRCIRALVRLTAKLEELRIEVGIDLAIEPELSEARAAIEEAKRISRF